MYESVEQEWLASAKAEIFTNVESGNCDYLEKEKASIIGHLNNAFVHQLSTSIIIVGSAEDSFMGNIVRNYLVTRGHPVPDKYVAHINGHLFGEDHEAIISISNQFMLRSGTDNNFNVAMEDLEDHLKQCKLDGIPAVIILEEFQVFAKKNRQVLIYTLLDLMHRKDLLFVLVGMTHNAAIHTLFEKRIISRLNAQYVFLSNPSAKDICHDLSKKMTLSLEDTLKYEEEGSGAQSDIISFRKQFNKQVHRLFGDLCEQEEREIVVSSGGSKEENAEDEGVEKQATKRMKTVESSCNTPSLAPSGLLLDTIEEKLAWGYTFDYFNRAVIQATISLGSDEGTTSGACGAANMLPTSYFYSQQLFDESFASLEPMPLAAQLNGLTYVELCMLVCVVRLHVLGRAFTVAQVLIEFDKLTSMGQKKVVPKHRFTSALSSLCNLGLIHLYNSGGTRKSSAAAINARGGNDAIVFSGRVAQVLASTSVLIYVPVTEIQAAFRGDRGDASNSSSSSSGNSSSGGEGIGSVVNVPERVKRAILEPLEPLVYRAGM